MTAESKQHEHSDLWTEGKREAETAGVQWDRQRRSGLKTLDLNELRMAAAVVGVDPSVSKSELVTALVEASCFLGPIGDETVYCEREGEAIPLLTKQGVPPHTSWTRTQHSISQQEATDE